MCVCVCVCTFIHSREGSFAEFLLHQKHFFWFATLEGGRKRESVCVYEESTLSFAGGALFLMGVGFGDAFSFLLRERRERKREREGERGRERES